MDGFDTKEGIYKKRIIETIFPEIIVKSEEELELRVNPEPLDCHNGRKKVAPGNSWRDGGDLNPRPPA